MAYAARVVARIQPAASLAATPLQPPRALSGCTTVQQQNFVAKSAISVVEGGDAFVGVKQNTRPIIVIDNYDSFTYNLCQYMGEVGANFEVYRNDEITVEEIKKLFLSNQIEMAVTPQDSGISLQTVTELGPSIPLFGVCMGLQCIGEALGGKVVRSPYGVVHGKGSLVHYDEKLDGTLFSGLPNPFQAGRYHSLVIEKDSFPRDALEIVAWTDDGLIMAARHRKYRHIQGVQFHPESIITTEGRLMVKNFIKIIEGYEALNGIP
ncbi:anthranilate synthase beta subunit 2, chloroplastic-like [Panicum miliaceum]|uniref:anthranilate synthase n=1 Tax=Panicum miliaceum TaxID=4540 RepID=A0A3L6SG34_PANMI|nr:anthranilate synthase beta subunit 2, chloroplastic-like [Panicum miliaceum]